MVTQASDARKRKPHAMIVAGGDGAVNLVARTLVGSPIRLAILPLGKCNNIFRSLIGPPGLDRAFEALISDSTRKIDCGKVSGQPFFGSIGLGMLPALVRSLDSRALPRFSFGWSRLANRADADIDKAPMGVKVDSYRFDLEPTIVNVNLLPYSFGLPLAPSASPDDQKFEVTLDIAAEPGTLSKFVRSLLKRTQRYDGAYTLYRGDEVTIGSVKDRTLYLDGELIKVPTNTLEVRLYSKQLRICAPPVPA